VRKAPLEAHSARITLVAGELVMKNDEPVHGQPCRLDDGPHEAMPAEKRLQLQQTAKRTPSSRNFSTMIPGTTPP